jgi:F-type H+-transporting ATPase subunit gamma
MPNLKDLRKRVATVRSTQQITKAMKMVAAAKLRRAQEAAEQARPYAKKLAEMFQAVAGEAGGADHPLLARRDERRIDILILTSDRGLCGGYNANILRQAQPLLTATGRELSTVAVGKKAVEFLTRRQVPMVSQRVGVANESLSAVAGEIVEVLTERFANEETDAVYLVYSKFRSAISQIPSTVQLLPVALPEAAEADPEAGLTEYIFEPPKRELLGALLPAYIRTQVLQALLESIAGEHGARMTAMENATNNASDMIDRLTLSMNRARQAAITTELMEIVSGAEALKG